MVSWLQTVVCFRGNHKHIEHIGNCVVDTSSRFARTLVAVPIQLMKTPRRTIKSSSILIEIQFCDVKIPSRGGWSGSSPKPTQYRSARGIFRSGQLSHEILHVFTFTRSCPCTKPSGTTPRFIPALWTPLRGCTWSQLPDMVQSGQTVV